MTHPPSTDGPSVDGLVAVVPVYNAGTLLRGVLEGIERAGTRCIVVDDGSTDGGALDVGDLAGRVIRFEKNRGKGHALLAGFRAALEDDGVQAVAVLDADGQHDPAELARLYDTFNRVKAGLLIGARTFDGGDVPLRSRLGNVLTARVMRRLLGADLPDTQSGYRILSRPFLEAVLEEIRGGRYETETAIIGLAIRRGEVIVSEPIRTIYIEGNATSHFRKVRDSWLIYRTLWEAARKRSSTT